MDLWDASHAPEKFGVRIEGVDMTKLILAGVSPRGMMSLTRAARVVAWLSGRLHLTPADIYAVAPWTLSHRVFFTPVYELRRGPLADTLIGQMLEKIATPAV